MVVVVVEVGGGGGVQCTFNISATSLTCYIFKLIQKHCQDLTDIMWGGYGESETLKVETPYLQQQTNEKKSFNKNIL